MARKPIDLTGQRFGKWVVLERASIGKRSDARWFCRCECGREKIVRSDRLRGGYSRQCRSCAFTTHGFSGTKLYKAWKEMIQRCENANAIRYEHYGGRGILICSEWRNDFVIFRKWALFHGYKEGLTIDRINNDGDYEPENCQFITNAENVLKAWHIDGVHGEKYLKAS